MNFHTISIFTENSPGVLHRITVIFTRRKLNIESLTVSETERKGISRFTICVISDPESVEKVLKQIARIVEVRDVSALSNNDLVYKEIAFYRVHTSDAEQRTKVEELSKNNGAAILKSAEGSIVIEKTGTEEEVNSLYSLLESFGIREFVRSGRIAITK